MGKNVSVYQEIDEERDGMFGKTDENVEKSSNEQQILCRCQRSSIQD